MLILLSVIGTFPNIIYCLLTQYCRLLLNFNITRSLTTTCCLDTKEDFYPLKRVLGIVRSERLVRHGNRIGSNDHEARASVVTSGNDGRGGWGRKTSKRHFLLFFFFFSFYLVIKSFNGCSFRGN